MNGYCLLFDALKECNYGGHKGRIFCSFKIQEDLSNKLTEVKKVSSIVTNARAARDIDVATTICSKFVTINMEQLIPSEGPGSNTWCIVGLEKLKFSFVAI